MTAPLCKAAYTRPDGTTLLCQYLRHSSLQHSWSSTASHDLLSPSLTTVMVQRLVDAIEGGLYDPYLEAILAAGHNRKRARRGVIGFVVPDASI